MRRIIRLDSTFIAALSVLTFIGCESANNTASDNRPTVTAENFTTQGKPTKTVQTPWGDKHVYDPTQDPEIIEAFEYVKRTHQRYGPDAKYDQLKPYSNLFTQIRNIQYLDMGRLGCQDIKRPACNNTFDNFTQNIIYKNCPSPSFGAAVLDDCESAYSKIETEREIETVALNVAHLPTQCSSAYFGYIGSKERQDTLWETEESVSDYFKLSCNSFEERVDNGDRERLPQ